MLIVVVLIVGLMGDILTLKRERERDWEEIFS